jgi:hypothetical protein
MLKAHCSTSLLRTKTNQTGSQLPQDRARVSLTVEKQGVWSLTCRTQTSRRMFFFCDSHLYLPLCSTNALLERLSTATGIFELFHAVWSLDFLYLEAKASFKRHRNDMIFGKIVNIHKKHTRFNSNFMGLLAVLQMSFLAAACRQLIVDFGRFKSGTGSTLDTAPAG